MNQLSRPVLGQLRPGVGAALTVLAAFNAGAATTSTVVGNGVVLACSQPAPLELRCDYRLTGPGRPLAAVASIRDVVLPEPSFAARTGPAGSVAVLLLVDTSDPAREPAIRKLEQHVARLVDGSPPNKRFGLAAFDSDLRLLAPIGSPPAALKASAASLQARGSTTELYRNVVQAVKLLTTVTDEHKVLVLLSDGLAEDLAYFHEDAVRAALDARIAIYGIGYPRSVALSVGLQSLRRLAEDTGGKFVATNADFALPETFFRAPFAEVENVGALNVDLTAAAEALPGGPVDLRIVLETSAGAMFAVVPVALPVRSDAEPVISVVEVEVPKVVEVEEVIRAPPPSPTVRPDAAIAATPVVPLRYWVAAIGALALALLTLLAILLLQRRAGAPAAPATAEAETQPVSFVPPMVGSAELILDEKPDRPHAITSAIFRIGRLADNDLVLKDASVSRHHAEIRRHADGHFHVVDLNSLNGVLINGKSVLDGELATGDVLEIGDVSMRLHVGPPLNADAEDLAVLGAAEPPDRRGLTEE